MSCQNSFQIILNYYFYKLKKIKSNSLSTVWYALRPSQQPTVSQNYSQSIKINIGPSESGTIVPSTHRPTALYYIEDCRSFNLFLSNCWLLAFGFLQGSAVKSRFWTFFSVNCCCFAQQPRIRIFKPGFQNPGFQFPVSNTSWYFIFQITPEIRNSRFTLKSPVLNTSKSSC